MIQFQELGIKQQVCLLLDLRFLDRIIGNFSFDLKMPKELSIKVIKHFLTSYFNGVAAS